MAGASLARAQTAGITPDDAAPHGRRLEVVWDANYPGTSAPAVLPSRAAPHIVAFHRGYMCATSGEAGKAAELFRAAIKIKNDLAEAYYALGVIAYDAGQLEEAIKSYRTATGCDRNFEWAYFNLGLALHDCRQFPDAIAAYRDALRINPGEVRTRYNLGIALGKSGDHASAIKEFREAVRLDSHLAEAHYNIGVALGSGDPAAAMDAYRDALAIDPDHDRAWFNLGNALGRSGQLAEAAAAYGQVLRCVPRDAEAALNLGLTLDAAGSPAEAVAALGHALIFEPDVENRIAIATTIQEIASRSTGQEEAVGLGESKAVDYTALIMSDMAAEFYAVADDALKSGVPLAEFRDAIRKLTAKAETTTRKPTARAKAKPRPKWESRTGDDLKLSPPEFIAKHYAAEMANGTLHRGVIAQQGDKLLVVKLANWLRTHPMPEGIDIPTLPEWNTRQLAKLEGGEAELLRLYGVARRRKERPAAPAAV